MKNLETEFTFLEELITSTKSKKYTVDLKEKKARLVDLLGVRGEGALVRKEKWSEQNCSFFTLSYRKRAHCTC